MSDAKCERFMEAILSQSESCNRKRGTDESHGRSLGFHDRFTGVNATFMMRSFCVRWSFSVFPLDNAVANRMFHVRQSVSLGVW
jgi:hypothetical protein